jgi:hypothetical protein
MTKLHDGLHLSHLTPADAIILYRFTMRIHGIAVDVLDRAGE